MVGGCEASNGEKALYIGRTWWRSKVSFFTICLFPSISIITVVVNPHSQFIFFFTSPFVCFQSVWNNIVTVHPHLNWRQLDCHLNWTMLWQRSLIMSGFNCRNCQYYCIFIQIVISLPATISGNENWYRKHNLIFEFM